MPVDGLPDPAIHRKCRRCGGWFHLHEGLYDWPPRRGLLSGVHVMMAKNMGLDRKQKFYCRPCLALNQRDDARFLRQMRSTILSITLLVAGALLAEWIGVTDLVTEWLRR